MGIEIRPGVAIELPEGIFNVVGQWQYSGLALRWWLWELDNGEGQRTLLARVDRTFYRPRRDTVDTLPEDVALDFEGMAYKLHHRGEARAERTSDGAHDFWLADFRHYQSAGKVLIFTADNDATHRLVGEELDGKLVRVYQG